MLSAIKRDVSDQIVKYLGTNNIIVLHGARQVGKTYLLYYLTDLLKAKGESTYFVDLEDSRFVDILDQGVDALLTFLKSEGINLENIKAQNKKLYLFIDEIQYLTSPSPLLKLLNDHHPYLQLIVSGSSSFNIKTKFADALVGRTVDFEIFNLSFAEFLRFKNISVNLTNLSSFHLNKVTELYKEYILYGGYPKVVLENSIDIKEKYLQQIIDTYIKRDIRDLANIKNVQKFNNLLKLLASQSGQLLNVNQLCVTCGLSRPTIENYLFILESTYIIKLLPPYSSSAKVEIVKSPKVFFYDTGLLQMLWLKTLPGTITGNVFETSIFTELVKSYGQVNLYFWRNKNQNEIDFILQDKNGLTPIEVKENFANFNRLSMISFSEKYHANHYKVIGLTGKKTAKNYYYPWEL